ncbi:altronate hydrolase [Sphingobacteriaceae bacterium]|nr:altronate hydrolase [Sphingobacteriaceae bacterium]
MKRSVLKVHPKDNVIVALQDLAKGSTIQLDGKEYILLEDIPAKHKFISEPVKIHEPVIMYGVLVGKAKEDLQVGVRISTENLHHASSSYDLGERRLGWNVPETTKFNERTFNGYHRSDGSVGISNYWLIIPLVFCENRNVEVMREALLDELGYARPKKYKKFTENLINLYKAGKSVEEILQTDFTSSLTAAQTKLFENIDGVKFLTHEGGCGGIRQDSQTLCGLLAGYITHPNVAGATILSLGCQNAQVSILQEEIKKRSANFDKPLIVLEQQKIGKETDLISKGIRETFGALIAANENKRKPAPISKLVIGLECGGSDGFSGISANPAIGYTSDLLIAAGGSVILSEFPELCGVEQELSDRCTNVDMAKKFMHLMKTYNQRAEDAGSGFYMNPSPGNIKDGLITDAIKSAGAAKKGGTSPVADVLDYPEQIKNHGLNLLCTPGNDVESTTAEVGSGATIVLFTTGLGTPTGNPIAPVVKLSSNTALYKKMPDIIDINAGTIIDGEETIEEAGERILDFVIRVASGEQEVLSVKNGQDDFIPWKRGVSL